MDKAISTFKEMPAALKKGRPGRQPRALEVKRWIQLEQLSKLSAQTLIEIARDQSISLMDKGKVLGPIWMSILKSITHKQGLDAANIQVIIENKIPAPGETIIPVMQPPINQEAEQAPGSADPTRPGQPGEISGGQ